MSFFNNTTDASGKQKLSILPEIWWFPVATIPLTVLVFVLWRLWQQRRLNQKTHTDSDARIRSLNIRRQGDRLKSLLTRKAEVTGLEAQTIDNDAALRRRNHSIRNLFAKKDEAIASVGRVAEDVP